MKNETKAIMTTVLATVMVLAMLTAIGKGSSAFEVDVYGMLTVAMLALSAMYWKSL